MKRDAIFEGVRRILKVKFICKFLHPNDDHAKYIKFCALICIAVPRRPCIVQWKHFSTLNEIDILNWYSDKVKIHDDSPEYARTRFPCEFDRKAASFTNVDGAVCKGIQLANYVKSRRGKSFKMPFMTSGSGSLNTSTCIVKELRIFNAFHKSLVG